MKGFISVEIEVPLDFPRAVANQTMRNRVKPPKRCGRHNRLSYDSEADILGQIQRQTEKYQPSTKQNK
jgi:hypothetical protein